MVILTVSYLTKLSQMPSLEKDTQFDINKVYLECIRRDNDGEPDFSIFIHKQDAFSIPGFTFFAPSSFSDKIEISSMQKSFLTFGFFSQFITEYSARKYEDFSL